MFLEEWKYVIKNKKIVNKINEDIELSESDESDDESDEWMIGPYFFKKIIDLRVYAIFGYELLNP